MSEERKDMDRRSFLKGAAAVVGAAAGSGLAMGAASAKEEDPPKPDKLYGMPKGDENSPMDDLGEVEPLYQAAAEQAMASTNKALEQQVKQGGRGRMNASTMLRAQGIRLRDANAVKLGQRLGESSLLARKAAEAQREGWHVHGAIYLFGIRVWHGHLSW